MIQEGFKFRLTHSFVSVSALYSLRICFRQYLFPYSFPGFLYSFLLLQKNMKTNMVAPSSVRFRAIFIPTSEHPSGTFLAHTVSSGPEKIHKKVRCIWTPFGIDFLRCKNQAENNNWHYVNMLVPKKWYKMIVKHRGMII